MICDIVHTNLFKSKRVTDNNDCNDYSAGPFEPLPLRPYPETSVEVGHGREELLDMAMVITGVEAKEVAKELAKAVAGQYRVKGTLQLVMLLKC